MPVSFPAFVKGVAHGRFADACYRNEEVRRRGGGLAVSARSLGFRGGRRLHLGLRGIHFQNRRRAGLDIWASSTASQLVSRMQPWELEVPTSEGSGVP